VSSEVFDFVYTYICGVKINFDFAYIFFDRKSQKYFQRYTHLHNICRVNEFRFCIRPGAGAQSITFFTISWALWHSGTRALRLLGSLALRLMGSRAHGLSCSWARGLSGLLSLGHLSTRALEHSCNWALGLYGSLALLALGFLGSSALGHLGSALGSWRYSDATVNTAKTEAGNQFRPLPSAFEHSKVCSMCDFGLLLFII
jgi:hypothetical protein